MAIHHSGANVDAGLPPAKQAAASTHGIVLYCDAGARPTNPGFAGWGIHGYLYANEKPKKGSGQPTNTLTAQGYVPKSENKNGDTVAPIMYFDGVGTFGSHVTNNVGEIQAAVSSLELALEHDVSKVHILTDSKYVGQGMEQWVQKWMRNNWCKDDGSPISNVDYWKKLIDLRTQLEDKGAVVSFGWVKGHGTDLGNNIADWYATIGIMRAMRDNQGFKLEVDRTQADGYWKYDSERHPMLSNTRIYFNTLSQYLVPGEYYLGEHGNDDELAGTRNSEGAHSYVRLKQPDLAIELFRNFISKMAENGSTDNIMFGRIDKLFRPDTHRLVSRYKEMSFVRPNPYRLDFQFVDKEPLAEERRPAKLAIRAVECLTFLHNKLDQYLAGDKSITTTDLTPIFYETKTEEVKKGGTKTVTTLHPRFVVGYASEKTNVNYNTTGVVETADVNLVLGIDLPDRNSLKRMESAHPKVTLITWKDAEAVFRYATVVEADGDVGIWAGCYSNFRYITDRDVKNQ